MSEVAGQNSYYPSVAPNDQWIVFNRVSGCKTLNDCSAYDNAAARLLSRPGEAIYNDANGLVEGNDLFQVVWLPDERREAILQDLDQRMQGRPRQLPHPQPRWLNGALGYHPVR